MIRIRGVSLYSFRVAIRWSSMFGHYPNKIDNWTQKESDEIQAIANECDRRQALKHGY